MLRRYVVMLRSYVVMLRGYEAREWAISKNHEKNILKSKTILAKWTQLEAGEDSYNFLISMKIEKHEVGIRSH